MGVTNFDIVEAAFVGNVTGNVTGGQTGAIMGSIAIEDEDDYSLTTEDKANFVFLLKMTAASKTFTLGLPDGQVAIVYNNGSETFTVKNVGGAQGDSGTSLETGKIILIVASTTKNASKVIALN